MKAFQETQRLMSLAQRALDLEEQAYNAQKRLLEAHQGELRGEGLLSDKAFHKGRQVAYSRMWNEILKELPDEQAKSLIKQARQERGLEQASDQLRVGTNGKVVGA